MKCSNRYGTNANTTPAISPAPRLPVRYRDQQEHRDARERDRTEQQQIVDEQRRQSAARRAAWPRSLRRPLRPTASSVRSSG